VGCVLLCQRVEGTIFSLLPVEVIYMIIRELKHGLPSEKAMKLFLDFSDFGL